MTLLAVVVIGARQHGYHIEHHWYPSVPFYRLPELHALLARRPGFRAHAQCERSILDSLRHCVTPGIRDRLLPR